MLPIDKNIKICANCTFWCGARNIDGYYKRAEVENVFAKGKCINPKGYYNCQCSYNGTCNYFSKHAAIN